METIITTDTRTLSGYLVGIGKIHKDGSEDYQIIKPIKNMIVKQGLNNWLRYNGNDSLLAPQTDQTSEVWSWPAKHIDYCLFGLSNDANDFATTTELAQLPNINPYKTKRTSWPYCGTKPYDNNGKYIIRVSHVSPAVTNNYPVKEIGYYTRFSGGTLKLFSRIALPFTYQLDAGDQLITTYELVINFPYSYSETPTLQTTLKDANGVNLDGIAKLTVGKNNNNIYFNFPHIKENGNYEISFNTNSSSYKSIAMIAPIFTSASTDHTSLNYFDAVRDFPANGTPDTNDANGIKCDESASRAIPTVSDYLLDTFSRNIIINCPTFWPKMTDPTQYTDIYYLNFLSFAVKLGHTVDGVFTPAAWRKYANHTARFVYKQTVVTQESIDWLANQ